PGGHRPELPGQAAHPHARCARAVRRRPLADSRGGAPRARAGPEHPGAAEPLTRGLSASPGRGPQRLGRHLAAHAGSHQPREAVAPPPRAPERRRPTEGRGFRLRERLAIYPEFATRAEFLDERLRARVGALIDEHGLVKESYERWRRWEPPRLPRLGFLRPPPQP